MFLTSILHNYTGFLKSKFIITHCSDDSSLLRKFLFEIFFCNVLFQTHTQAERKILEERKKDLLREPSESSLRNSALQDKFAELDSLKPRPYGTLHAVSISDFLAFILLNLV